MSHTFPLMNLYSYEPANGLARHIYLERHSESKALGDRYKRRNEKQHTALYHNPLN